MRERDREGERKRDSEFERERDRETETERYRERETGTALQQIINKDKKLSIRT